MSISDSWGICCPKTDKAILIGIARKPTPGDHEAALRAAALGATYRPSAAEKRLRSHKSTGDLNIMSQIEQDPDDRILQERNSISRQVSCLAVVDIFRCFADMFPQLPTGIGLDRRREVQIEESFRGRQAVQEGQRTPRVQV